MAPTSDVKAHRAVRTKRALLHALNDVAKKHDASAYPPNGSGDDGIFKPRDPGR
jgi:hypothetical protein